MVVIAAHRIAFTATLIKIVRGITCSIKLGKKLGTHPAHNQSVLRDRLFVRLFQNNRLLRDSGIPHVGFHVHRNRQKDRAYKY